MNSKSSIVKKFLPNLGRLFVIALAGIIFLSIFSDVSSAQVVAANGVAANNAANAAQPSISEVISRMLPMFAMVFMIYYFMIVKPQQVKVKTQADLTASLKKGDSVVTSGGIFGRVSAVESDGISIEVSPNVKIKVESAHIARKVELEVSSASNSAAVARSK